MERLPYKLLYLMLVIIPYFILVGYSIAVYPDLPDKLENDFPKIMIFIPALVSVILPITYAVMVFHFDTYLKKSHYIVIAAFMDIGILGLVGATYLIKDSA